MHPQAKKTTYFWHRFKPIQPLTDQLIFIPPMKSKYSYIIVVLALILFCYLSMPRFFSNGFDGSYNNIGDGLKNYYTLIKFIQEPIGPKGIFYFEFFQYPFGDYVYTADNTPIYALFMRWVHNYVTPVEPFVIPLFNFLIAANIVLCGVLLNYLLRRILPSRSWALALAIILPLSIEQLLRVPRGVFNLSLSSIFVLSFLLCYWYIRYVKSRKRSFSLLFCMFLISVIGFLTHGYYLPILCILFFCFLFFFHLRSIESSKDLLLLLRPVILVALIGLFSYGLMMLTDGYFDLRQRFAQGYDSPDQKVNLSYFYQSYPHNTLNFPVRVSTYFSFAEPHMYMGHAFWGLLFTMLIAGLINTGFRRRMFRALYDISKDRFLLPLFLSSFILLLISTGDTLYGAGIRLSVIRLFNFDRSGELYLIHYIAIAAVLISIACFLLFIFFELFRAPRSKRWFRSDKKEFLLLMLTVAVLVTFLFTNWPEFEFVKNRVNPFYYLKKVTRIVEQFRSIARFAWPFLIVGPILLIYIYLKAKPSLTRVAQGAVVILLLSLSATLIVDNINYIKKAANLPDLFSDQELVDVPVVERNKYSAVVPIPFFMVGSEDYNITIDDHDDFSRWLYQFCYKNHLPMMATKLSRTPPIYSDHAMNMLLNRKMDQPVLDLMPQKPVLVVVSKQYMEGDTAIVLEKVTYQDRRPKATQANAAQYDFVKDPGLKFLYTKAGADFYEWQVK